MMDNPTNELEAFIECGCCSAWHRASFRGDCRNDAERFDDPPEGAPLIELYEQSNPADAV